MKRLTTTPKINLTERLSATIEPEVLRESRQLAQLCGFGFRTPSASKKPSTTQVRVQYSPHISNSVMTSFGFLAMTDGAALASGAGVAMVGVEDVIGAAVGVIIVSLIGLAIYEKGHEWWVRRYGPFPIGRERNTAPESFPMKENARFIIIGLAIVIAVSIHACSTRYYSIGNQRVLDRWTGHVQKSP